MKKRLISRALALFMALSLLSTTAFAASFADLQGAINDTNNSNGEEFTTTSGETRYGYAKNEDNSYGIEAWNSDNGSRNIQLNENVNYAEDDNSGIIIENKANVTLNMNGNTIDLNPGATLDVETGTFMDEDGNVAEANQGAVITVKPGASLTVNGAGENGEKGTITGGNHATPTAGAGGGMSLSGTVELSDVAIEGNKAVDGGGIYVSGMYTTAVTMNNVDITGNVATNTGGGIGTGGGSKSVTTLNNTNIVGNNANWGGGITLVGGVPTTNSATLVMTSGVIANNTAATGGDDVYISPNGTIKLPDASTMTDANGNPLLLDEDGKAITGWYYDGGSAWGGDGKNAYYQYSKVNGKWNGHAFLKAAHDQYFTVSFTDGVGEDGIGTPYEGQTSELVKGSTVPNAPDDPVREGYTFDGWKLADGSDFDPNTTVTNDITVVAQWRVEEAEEPENPGTGEEPETPEEPGVTIPDGDIPLAGGTDDGAAATTIEDNEIPLAGLVSVAQLLEYLREHDGIADVELPEDFQWIDHEYAQAIYWGLQEELVIDTEDAPLDPDEIVTVAILKDVMTNYAEYLDTTFDVVIEDEDDMVVMNCDEILAEFYASLEDLAA